MTPTTAAHRSAKLLAAATTAPLFELDDGAGPLLVVLPPEVLVAAADEDVDEDVDDEVRVAMLMVLFRCKAVPVAAIPLAPEPTAPVPTAPVPTAPVPTAVVVALAMTTGVVVVVLLLEEPPPMTPPDDAELVVAAEDADAELEVDETLEEELEPPVRVIMPV